MSLSAAARIRATGIRAPRATYRASLGRGQREPALVTMRKANEGVRTSGPTVQRRPNASSAVGHGIAC